MYIGSPDLKRCDLVFISISNLASSLHGDCRGRLPLQGLRLQGGSGWRGPDGFCVSKSKLAEICGTPAEAPCKEEAAPRVCFGNS